MNGISPHMFISQVMTAISLYAASNIPREAEMQQQFEQIHIQAQNNLEEPHLIDITV